MAAVLQRVVLYVREAGAAAAFWSGALQLPVVASGEGWTELAAGGGARLTLQVVDRESHLCTGYSPVLQFGVADMDTLIPTLLQAGATLDGGIQYTPVFKVAMMRAPTGHMFAVKEDTAPPPPPLR